MNFWKFYLFFLFKIIFRFKLWIFSCKRFICWWFSSIKLFSIQILHNSMMSSTCKRWCCFMITTSIFGIFHSTITLRYTSHIYNHIIQNYWLTIRHWYRLLSLYTTKVVNRIWIIKINSFSRSWEIRNCSFIYFWNNWPLILLDPISDCFTEPVKL